MRASETKSAGPVRCQRHKECTKIELRRVLTDSGRYTLLVTRVLVVLAETTLKGRPDFRNGAKTKQNTDDRRAASAISRRKGSEPRNARYLSKTAVIQEEIKKRKRRKKGPYPTREINDKRAHGLEATVRSVSRCQRNSPPEG